MKKAPVKRPSFASMLKRRDVLGFIGGTVAVSLLANLRQKSALSEAPLPTQVPNTAPACVVKPQQTEGPYFVDEKLNRSDIRSNPSDGSVKQGVPLRLVIQVSQVGDFSCTPLKDAIVDLWHCDALGVYSDVADPNFDTSGKKFLRGYQVTDANGRVEFLTIYPGWYSGRTVHIHFKIRAGSTSQSAAEFTSQLYFDDALTDRVHQQPPYSFKGKRTTTNTQDGIFQGGGDQLLLQLTPETNSYVGTFNIGLEIS